jgi:hypothetical protein
MNGQINRQIDARKKWTDTWTVRQACRQKYNWMDGYNKAARCIDGQAGIDIDRYIV